MASLIASKQAQTARRSVRRGMEVLGAILACLTALPRTADAQTITQLFAFPCPGQLSGTCPDGYSPNQLIQASDGNFYGTAQLTTIGNSNPQGGTVFKITPTGRFTRLFTFTANASGTYVNGDDPSTALVEANDGFLYGTTFNGGASDNGVLFRISKTGQSFKVLHNFCSVANCADGNLPLDLILGHDGNLYGVTEAGGSNNSICQPVGGCGTIFRFTPPSTFTTLFTFDGSNQIGGFPTGLLQGSDGNFYGTINSGAFRLVPGGQFTVLATIPPVGPNPSHANSKLVEAPNGSLYGSLTTYSIEQLQFYKVNAAGGGFQEFPSFGFRSDSERLVPRLIQASDGNLWDAVTDPTIGSGDGSVIALSPADGSVVRSFEFDGTNGGTPAASIVQAPDGTIYGTATAGGKAGSGSVAIGTVWHLNASLPAPQSTVAAFTPASGAVGSTVLIRGDHFIGTTAVTINGVSATFKVLNTNFIRATVPSGATTGPIAVTNPGGKTISTQNFTVQ